MAAERKTPEGGAVTRWETRVQTALGAGRRQFVYQWNAPRSPVLRLLLLPLLLVATLVVLVLAVLLFAIVVAVGVAAVIASRFGLLRRRG